MLGVEFQDSDNNALISMKSIDFKIYLATNYHRDVLHLCVAREQVDKDRLSNERTQSMVEDTL